MFLKNCFRIDDHVLLLLISYLDVTNFVPFVRLFPSEFFSRVKILFDQNLKIGGALAVRISARFWIALSSLGGVGNKY